MYLCVETLHHFNVVYSNNALHNSTLHKRILEMETAAEAQQSGFRILR